MQHEVFISYHRNSSAELVEHIVAALESHGIKCWYAPRDVDSSYAGDIVKAINTCKVFLLVMNEQSSHSAHVLNEIDCAFNRFHQHESIRLLPFRTDNREISVMSGIILDGFIFWMVPNRQKKTVSMPLYPEFLIGFKAVNGTTMPNQSFRFRAYTVPPLYTTQILLAGHLNLTKYTIYFIATTINYFYAEPVALEKVNLPDNMD